MKCYNKNDIKKDYSDINNTWRMIMENKKKYKFKIAMIGHKRIPSREGGVEVVVEELSSRMVQRGNDVTCYNRGGHHVSGKQYEVIKLKEYKGIRLKTVPTLNVKGLAAITSSVFASIFSSFKNYDVVHFHAEGPSVMCWLPHILGKKVVVTIHGLDWKRAKWGNFASKYILLGEKNAVRYADEIIVLSKGVQKYFLDTYKKKTTFVPNGVNVPQKKEVDLIREKWKLEKDEYILYLGRIVPEKGIQYLIEAFKKVQTDKKLVIAGGASNSDAFMSELKEMAKLDKRIVFTGFVTGQVLEELYSNSYIYVLPSDLEGMPLSLLEAMSYGNCCLVSSIDECVEVVEDHAVVFRKGSIKDLKEKIQNLCDDKIKVQELKDEAENFICTKYDWDAIVEQTLEIYGEKI